MSQVFSYYFTCVTLLLVKSEVLSACTLNGEGFLLDLGLGFDLGLLLDLGRTLRLALDSL